MVLVNVKQKLMFCLKGKKDRKYVRVVIGISWKLQHRLVVVDLDEKVPRKSVKK